MIRAYSKLRSAMTGAIVTYCVALALSGCGYSIRNGKNGALEKEGVRKIYLSPVVNNTYRYGVENVVYNSLVRSLSAYSGIRLVSDPTLADAVLTGRVIQAYSQINSSTLANALNPPGLPLPQSFGSILVANDYNAILNCSFQLVRREAILNHPVGTIWAGDFSRSKLYPGSNQLGVLGTTSGLINDSEFDRTIIDISRDMAVDVRESMLSRF